MTDLHHDIFCRRLFDYLSNAKERLDETGMTSSLDYETHKVLGDYQDLMAKCESPIERILGVELLFCIDGYQPLRYASSEEQVRTDEGAYFLSQAPIGPYRADFLIVCLADEYTSKPIVECDGHDYHERTRPQASRDKRRDRDLMTMGMPVYRFTGSDLYRDSRGCKEEIERYIAEAMDGLLIRSGKLSAGSNHA